MKERGRVIVVPGDSIDCDYYDKKVVMNHLEAFQDFSDKFGLGYHFALSEYQKAPVLIANQGHLVVRTLDDLKSIIFYLPKRLNVRQRNFFEDNRFMFFDYSYFGAFLVDSDDENLIGQAEGSLRVYEEVRRRYHLYKEEMENARKEI